jgi:hypothetical protein
MHNIFYASNIVRRSKLAQRNQDCHCVVRTSICSANQKRFEKHRSVYGCMQISGDDNVELKLRGVLSWLLKVTKLVCCFNTTNKLNIKIAVFWYVTPCAKVHFRGTCCFYVVRFIFCCKNGDGRFF